MFLCTIKRSAYRLLLPVTQLIHLTYIVIMSDVFEKHQYEALDYFIITVLAPIVLFSTLRFSMIITVANNSLIFCIVRPLMRGTSAVSLIVGFCTCLISALSLIMFEKAIIGQIWRKLKMSQANEELHEVVNASNQGVLIYCRETNRLLLQNATARKFFSPLQRSGTSLFISSRDVAEATRKSSTIQIQSPLL